MAVAGDLVWLGFGYRFERGTFKTAETGAQDHNAIILHVEEAGHGTLKLLIPAAEFAEFQRQCAEIAQGATLQVIGPEGLRNLQMAVPPPGSINGHG